jgi:WhiB family redox-sensing transcriptional regulator
MSATIERRREDETIEEPAREPDSVTSGGADVHDVDLALPCHAEDPELFFAESPTDVELAKAVCLPCPLRTACLDAALERREPWGVWGGQLVLQGTVVPRKRGPGRPRKDEQALVA